MKKIIKISIVTLSSLFILQYVVGQFLFIIFPINYTPPTYAFQRIPPEYEYCHMALDGSELFLRNRDETEENFEYRKKTRFVYGLIPVTHHNLVNINTETETMTYRKWSYLLPLGTFEYQCNTEFQS